MKKALVLMAAVLMAAACGGDDGEARLEGDTLGGTGTDVYVDPAVTGARNAADSVGAGTTPP